MIFDFLKPSPPKPYTVVNHRNANDVRGRKAFRVLQNWKPDPKKRDKDKDKVVSTEGNFDMDEMNNIFIDLKLDSSVTNMENIRTMYADVIRLVNYKMSRPEDGEDAEQVKAKFTVYLMITTGGGEVTAYGMISDLTKTLAKHVDVIAVVDRVAASGGYMLASVCKEIIVAPFSYTGSVGVVSNVPNFNKVLDQIGVEVVEETAGKSKRSITPTSEITDEKLSRFREDLERIHGIFKTHVLKTRTNIKEDEIDDILDGSVFCGEEAIEKGLADSIGTSFDILMDKQYNTNEGLYIFTPAQKEKPKSGIFAELLTELTKAVKMVTSPETKL